MWLRGFRRKNLIFAGISSVTSIMAAAKLDIEECSGSCSNPIRTSGVVVEFSYCFIWFCFFINLCECDLFIILHIVLSGMQSTSYTL